MYNRAEVDTSHNSQGAHMFTILLLLTLVSNPTPYVQPPIQIAPAKPKIPMRITCDDGTVLSIQLMEERIPIKTKYGDLSINTTDIQRIDFANRIADSATTEALGHIKNLAASDFNDREQATAKLKELAHRAYPVVITACKSTDPEVARRSDEVARHIRNRCDKSLLVIRPDDVIVTADSRISGRITISSVKVLSNQFGEQELRLSDARTAVGKDAGIPAEVAPAPGTLGSFNGQFGKELFFKLTGGLQVPGITTSVWGTDTYTLDSNLAHAAVHAGVLKPGEEGIIRVRIVTSLQQFVASERNGVTSSTYGVFNNGAFEFVK